MFSLVSKLFLKLSTRNLQFSIASFCKTFCTIYIFLQNTIRVLIGPSTVLGLPKLVTPPPYQNELAFQSQPGNRSPMGSRLTSKLLVGDPWRGVVSVVVHARLVPLPVVAGIVALVVVPVSPINHLHRSDKLYCFIVVFLSLYLPYDIITGSTSNPKICPSAFRI